MRLSQLGFIALAAVTTTSIGCSGGRSSSAPPTGNDAGDDGGGAAFDYAPASCKYTYSPPSALGYTNLALDDDGAVDSVQGVPARVRVGFGGGTTMGQPGYPDPTTSAAFTWETAQQNNAAKVQMGTSASALSQVFTGYAWTLPPGLGTANTYFHEVHVCGLTPDTTYYYQVGGGPTGGEVWSATQSFTTMPATIPSGGISIGIFGDARDTVGTWQAVHVRMKAAGVLMSLVDGDVVDIGAEETLYSQWLGEIWQYPTGSTNTFLTLGQQYILPINGNHENDTATSFANWAIPGDGPYAETYASFTVGSVHFTMIDDEQIAVANSSAEAQAQLAWVAQDLAAANADRANHPFVVVMGHRGLFSTSLHSTDPDVLQARTSLAPLYDQYKVDLVINGHDHEYERTYPITTGNPPTSSPTVQPAGMGTTYVICAGAGADAYAVGTTSVAYRVTKTAFGAGTPYIGAYTLLQIAPTQLTLTAYGLKASGSTPQDDDVIDTVTLSSP
ncbi:MAG: fibronectin type III domain-containing protein [Polyangiaceae bacterium]